MNQTTKSVESAVKFEVTARVSLLDLFTEDQVEEVEDFVDALRSGDDGTAYGVVDGDEFNKALEGESGLTLPVHEQLQAVVQHCRNNGVTVIIFL